MDDPDDLIRTRLMRIARALDLPPDHFFTSAAPDVDLAEANECLALWCRIRTPENRRRALEALRALAEADDA